MKSIEDAMRIRRRIFGAFELAESATDPAERKRWLTFALVGAGPAWQFVSRARWGALTASAGPPPAG
jgi:hypothetical protein